MDVTIREASALIGVSERTIYRMLDRGQIVRCPSGMIDAAQLVEAWSIAQNWNLTRGHIRRPNPAELEQVRRAARSILEFTETLGAEEENHV